MSFEALESSPELGRESARTYHCNGATLTPVVAWGRTWLREDELRVVLGYLFASHFRSVIEAAELYAGTTRQLRIGDDSQGETVLGLTVHGAMQLALHVVRISRGDRVLLAQSLLDTLYDIQSPSFHGAVA